METIADYVHYRALSSRQFRESHAHPFLLMTIPAEMLEKKQFAFKTEMIDQARAVEQFKQLADLRREGKCLSDDADNFLIFRVAKLAASPFIGRISIGRTEQCDVTIPDGRVSKLHAFIEGDARAGYALTDVGSRNGTKLNHQIIAANERVSLAFGSLVEIGSFVFRFIDAGTLLEQLRKVVVSTASDGKLSTHASHP